MKILARAPVRHRRRRPATAPRGFTLLEVLVAIVVLSFGVLGVVGLQAAALSANKEARYQSTAVALGRELADMMRGNKDVAIRTTAATNPYLGDYPPTATLTTTDDCFTAACTSQEAVARFNTREWLARVRAALPGVRAEICFDDAAYGSSGLPTWDCVAGGGVVVLKMGWTRQGYDRSASGPELAVAPVVVLPLIAGSVE
jgi:type IV pilus assembly protein PilV